MGMDETYWAAGTDQSGAPRTGPDDDSGLLERSYRTCPVAG
jgi:hypothetical protein